jgi:hypothetical protein
LNERPAKLNVIATPRAINLLEIIIIAPPLTPPFDRNAYSPVVRSSDSRSCLEQIARYRTCMVNNIRFAVLYVIRVG